MPEKKPNLLERFLFGENVNKGIHEVGEKGLFPYDQTYRYGNYSTPHIPINTYATFGTHHDYAVDAGDMIDSSLVMVVLNWLMRVFPRARCRVVLDTDDGQEPVKNHALTKLLKRPNPDYSGVMLWRSTVLSYNWSGNAYWRKVRNGAGQVIQLWYEPHWTIRPVRHNSNEFVSAYEVYRDNKWIEIPRRDVVHFRWVLDPRQQMLGLGPIDSALREIYTDNEASRYTAIMFRNLGVPGMIVTPKNPNDDLGDPATPDGRTELVRLKAELKQLTTGDNRGDPLLYSVPLDIVFPQVDPSKMAARETRLTPEARVAGLIGIHPGVVGLDVGLEHSTYNNQEEAVRGAYNNNILPAYDSMAEELDMQLVPDFTSVEDQTVEFDTSKIDAIKGDKAKKDTIVLLAWNSGAFTRAETRLGLGQKPAADGSDDVYKGAATAPEPPNVAGDTLPDDTEASKALSVFTHSNGHVSDLEAEVIRASLEVGK